MPPLAEIARNLADVRRRIETAAHKAHRSPSDVTLVAVSKTCSPDAVRTAAGAGQRVFGENRVQEATDKILALEDLGLEWHLIGHLQSNKAKKAAADVGWIESVDSVDLVAKLDRAAHELGKRLHVLLQVDLAREPTKHGVPEPDLHAVATATLAARALDLEGLMIVPPYADDPEASRIWFRRLKAVRDRLVASEIPPERLTQLSMGMSHDVEVAIEEGATIVRVGSAIFGPRSKTGVP